MWNVFQILHKELKIIAIKDTYPLHGSLSCHGKGACITQWSYETYHTGEPKTNGTQGRVLTKYGPLEEGMADHYSILAMRIPWTVQTAKKIWHWKISHPRLEGAQMLLGKSGRQLLIAPERMKQLGQSRNDAQLWVCLVVKFLCYKEQYCIGTWNVRSLNQGKLNLVKQEMARVNINILGISELKWTGMGEFNSDDHYTCLQCRRSWVRKIP